MTGDLWLIAVVGGFLGGLALAYARDQRTPQDWSLHTPHLAPTYPRELACRQLEGWMYEPLPSPWATQGHYI